MHMPVMDGLEATGILISMGVKTPIIAMTANAMKETRQECLDAGMTDYIAKPFKPRDLWDCLAKYLTAVESVINRDKGLLYLDYNETVYNKLLVKYLDEQPEMFTKLERAISDGDCKLAHGLAHQMKGISATIGAIRLPVLFNEIERVFVSGTPEGYATAMLDDCRTEIHKVFEAISAMELPTTEKPLQANTHTILDKNEAAKIIAEIKPKLEMYMSLPDEQIERVGQVLAPIGQLSVKLTDYLNEYEFDAAIETINEIEGLIGV
jgi:HPt (histidine-containing phosphotransfer) domain-containing protein